VVEGGIGRGNVNFSFWKIPRGGRHCNGKGLEARKVTLTKKLGGRLSKVSLLTIR
jgi:hypothetical protein